MDNTSSNVSREPIIIGKPIYSVTNTGFIVLRDSRYDYFGSEEVMCLIRKYGKVILDDEFDAPIPFIIDGVSVLLCGQKFNQPLDNLPSSLRFLQIGAMCGGKYFSNFTQSLQYLPHGLEELRIFAIGCPWVITKDIGTYLPATLKYLYINKSCLGFVLDVNQLPDSLEELYIKNISLHLEDIYKLPENLKLFCGDYSNNKYTTLFNELKTKFPQIEFKIVCISDYWLRSSFF